MILTGLNTPLSSAEKIKTTNQELKDLNTNFSSTINVTLFVDDDAEPTWYNETNYGCVQDAINNASSGDTVYVYNGIYYEHIIIDKSINLKGENKYNTILDGSKKGIVVNISKDNVDIANITIRRSGTTWRHSGVLFNGVRNCRIHDIVCRNNEYSIKLISSDDNIISNNIVRNNLQGISLEHSSNNEIINNSIYDNAGPGIWLRFDSNYNLIYSCNLTNEGIDCSTKNNKIFYNNIDSGRISLKYGGKNNLVEKNNISNYKHGIGIFFDLYSNNTIVHNNFFNCTQKTKISDMYSTESLLKLFQLKRYTNRNVIKENYWGKPSFFPKIIFGINAVFLPISLLLSPKGAGMCLILPHFSIDWHPAKKPYEI